MILRIVLYVLAALSLFYGFMIFRINSGSKFFLVWWLIGITLVLLGIAIRTGFFKKTPGWLNVCMATAAAAVLLLVIVILIKLISYSENNPKEGLDYIIVLGCQVREDGPSKTLRYRLEAAEEYLKKNPETICIVSGGKGTNEISSEAEAMFGYLVMAGISKERIILEDKSTDTNENIKFSKAFIPDGVSVGLVTNDFHLCRGVYLCKKHGIDNVYPIRAASEPFYRPNNYFREALAYIKDFLF